MHIKEANDGLYLVHCSWNLSRFCDDKGRDMQEEASNLNIPVSKITSGCCYACSAVMAHNEKMELEPFEEILLSLEEGTTNEEETIRNAIAESAALVMSGKITQGEHNLRIYALTSIQAKL